MKEITIKHRQHYVFQAYLRNWAPNDRIWCCRDKKIFPTNTVNIAQERDFYRMQDINADEKKFLSLFLHNQSKDLTEIMQKKIAIHEKVLRWKGIVEAVTTATKEIVYKGRVVPEEVNALFLQGEKIAEASVNDIYEDVYSEEEAELTKMLALLVKGDLNFYYQPFAKRESDFDNTRRAFLYYLCSQYFRTKATRSRLIMCLDNILLDDFWGKLGVNSANIRPEHITHHILWYVGCQLTDVLYAKKAHLTLLHNNSETPFITADQPIINLLGNYQNIMEKVEDLVFYYPISPRLAITVNDGNITNKITLSEDDVDHYNKAIVKASFEIVFGDSRSILDRYLK